MTGNRPPYAGCRRGVAFDDYVREHYPALRRLALLLCADWGTADDLMQTALIRCERRWHLVADPHPYVRRAVVNAASTCRLLALRSLPVGQRQVLLRYFEGLSETEIAAALGIRTGTVKSRAARGLDALRSCVPLRPQEASWT